MASKPLYECPFPHKTSEAFSVAKLGSTPPFIETKTYDLLNIYRCKNYINITGINNSTLRVFFFFLKPKLLLLLFFVLEVSGGKVKV